MNEDATRTLVPRTIEGTEVMVSTDAGELFLDVPASSPRYVRVGEGDTVQEGDVRSRNEQELASSGLEKWTIEAIGTDTVIGTDQKSGDRREWDRRSLEKQLVTGGLSTNLTDFERVSVTQTDGQNDSEGDGPGESTVTAVVYGNDGQKFTLTYRLADGDGDRQLEPASADKQVEKFDDELKERFARAVELGLRSEEYAV